MLAQHHTKITDFYQVDSKPQSLCNILPSTSNTPPDWITGNSYIQGFYSKKFYV